MDAVIRRLGATTLLAALVGALAAPWLAPHPGNQQFRDYLYAPPMRVRVLVGGVAGYAGGIVDETLMRFADLVLVLPTIYAVLALRAVLPPVLSVGTVFWLLVGLLTLAGWPYVARGVRAIVAVERGREYTLAAIAVGAGPIRILAIHLVPATRGFLTAQATLLLPAFILAEATLSYVGLGFAPPAASWGAMLSEASNISAIADFPWLLSPAAAIIAVVLAVNLASGAGARGGAFGALARSRRETSRGPRRTCASVAVGPASRFGLR